MVKVSVLTPPGAIEAGEKLLEIEGGRDIVPAFEDVDMSMPTKDILIAVVQTSPTRTEIIPQELARFTSHEAAQPKTLTIRLPAI